LEDRRERWAWYWLWVAMAAWIVIASARAGGDQWDNPRYRATMLLFQAALAVQVFFIEARQRRRGLIRLAEVEVAFVASFSAWTISRYDANPSVLSLQMAGVAFGCLSAFFLICDWLWERYRSRKPKVPAGVTGE
jgi:hypothetical protein